MRSLVLISTLFVCQTVAAQAFYIPNGDPTSGTCNVIPFGNTSTTTWFNQRYQTVVTAPDLGNTAGLISGLAFACCSSGMRHHDSLKVTFSLVPPGYVLQQSFAANLPVPVVVLDSQNYQWENIAHTWTAIGLQRYFPYDGSSDLVIEVIAMGNQGPGGMHRDTRPRAYATGWTGTPPPLATSWSSAAALKMEVLMGMAKISHHGAGCGGLQLSASGSSQLGSAQLDVDALGGAATSPIAINFGLTNGSGAFPISLDPAGMIGCFMYHDVFASVFNSTSGAGTSTTSLAPVPNNAALTGARLYCQYINMNAAAPGGWTTSNYVRIVVGN